MSFDAESSSSGPPIVVEEAANPYLRAVTRHWKLVVVIALVATAVGVVTVKRRGHSYQATSSILVSPINESNSDLIGLGGVTDSGDPARNVETAAALIDSPSAALGAAQSMGRGWSQGRVQSGVSVAPVGQSNVVGVTATAPSPGESAKLANAFAAASLADRNAIVQGNVSSELTQLKARQAALTSPNGAVGQDLATRINALESIQAANRDPTLALAARAQTPTSPTGASAALIVLLSLLGGAALGAVAALLVERFSGLVRDENEVSSLIRAPILSGVPKLSRGQMRNAPSPDSLPPAVFEQFRLLRAQLGTRQESPAIMITSADAGDGKTTVATALAAALAEIDQDVILLDLDLAKPDAANVFGITQRIEENALTNYNVRLEQMLVTVPEHPHLKILPTRQTDLVTFEAVIDRFPHLLAEAKQLAHWVIVDTPPLAAVSSGIRLVQVCDEVILVVRPRHTDRSRLILARDLLARVGAFVTGTVLVGQTIAKVRPSYGYGWTDGAPRRTSVPEGEPRIRRPERLTRSSAEK